MFAVQTGETVTVTTPALLSFFLLVAVEKTFSGKSTYIWSCRNTLLSFWSWKVLFLSLHSIQWHTIRLTSAWQIPFIPLCSPCIQLCWMEKKHLVCLVSLKHLPPFFLPGLLPHSLLPLTSFSTCLPLLHLGSDPSPLYPSRTRWQLFIIIFWSISHGL